jgi:hypothetical protein
VDKPPPLVLLAYRFFGWRLGPDHAEWVHDDITRGGWLMRQGTPALSAVLLLGALVTSLSDGDGSQVWGALLVLGIAALFFRTSLRQRALNQQGIDASGQPLGLKWYSDSGLRVQRNVLSAIGTTVLVVGALVILAGRS